MLISEKLGLFTPIRLGSLDHIKVSAVRYQGMIYDFGMLNGLAHLPQVKDLFVHASAEMQRHLA